MDPAMSSEYFGNTVNPFAGYRQAANIGSDSIDFSTMPGGMGQAFDLIDVGYDEDPFQFDHQQQPQGGLQDGGSQDVSSQDAGFQAGDFQDGGLPEDSSHGIANQQAQHDAGLQYQAQGSMLPARDAFFGDQAALPPGYASGTIPRSLSQAFNPALLSPANASGIVPNIHNLNSFMHSQQPVPARDGNATHAEFSGGSAYQQHTNYPAYIDSLALGLPDDHSNPYHSQYPQTQTGIQHQTQFTPEQSVTMPTKSSSGAKKTGGKQTQKSANMAPQPFSGAKKAGGKKSVKQSGKQTQQAPLPPANPTPAAGAPATLTLGGHQNYPGLTYPSYSSALGTNSLGRHPLNLDQDDWAAYKNTALGSATVEAFVRCFFANPNAMHDADSSETFISYANNTQTNALAEVAALVDKYGIKLLEMQCAKLLEKFIEANEFGPKLLKAKKSLIKVNTQLKCSERIKAGMDVIKANASVRLEIVQNKTPAMEMLAANPAGHLQSKKTNL